MSVWTCGRTSAKEKKLSMNNNTYAKNRSNAKNFFSNAKITHTMAQRNKQIYGKTISSSCAETDKWFCNYLRTQQQLRLKKWQRVYVIAFFQPCVYAYIHTYVCLCACVPVRVTYAAQNGMREKWALKEQRKEQVLITWQHRNGSARVLQRNETKQNEMVDGKAWGGVEGESKGKSPAIYGMEQAGSTSTSQASPNKNNNDNMLTNWRL